MFDTSCASASASYVPLIGKSSYLPAVTEESLGKESFPSFKNNIFFILSKSLGSIGYNRHKSFIKPIHFIKALIKNSKGIWVKI